MATLTVRNLDDAVVKRLNTRAAENRRSAEAEHREILRAALLADQHTIKREDVTMRLAEFRRRTASSVSPTVTEVLEESRATRTGTLTEGRDGA